MKASITPLWYNCLTNDRAHDLDATCLLEPCSRATTSMEQTINLGYIVIYREVGGGSLIIAGICVPHSSKHFEYSLLKQGKATQNLI